MSNFEVQRNGAPIGVFAPADLKAAALDGRILSTDEVRPEGTQQWVQASTIQALQFGSAASAGQPRVRTPRTGKSFPFHFFALIIEGFIGWLRKMLSGNRFTQNMKHAESLGHLGLLIVMAMVLILGLIVAIKADSLELLLTTLGTLVGLVLAQYAAYRFIKASVSLLEATPTTINGTVLLDVIGLVLTVGSVGLFGLGCFQAIDESSMQIFVASTLILVIGLLSACVAFNPSVLNISESETASAGEEAIGLASFFIKCLLLLGPFVYFFGALGAAYVLAEGLYYTLAKDAVQVGFVAAEAGAAVMLGAGFYTLVFYVVFLVYYLLVDVLGAILSMGRDVRTIAERQ